ncbi:MAG: hypothetical protein DI637_04760 [Citromicrobium sp.]|nr:MAG: hypothetical protein DI637_04760 [Citromicrobium sp.]
MKYASALLLFFAMPAAPAFAQAEAALDNMPAEELAEARLIIQAMYPPEQRDAMFEQMMAEITRQYGASAMSDPVFEEPAIRAIMDEFIASVPARLMPSIRKHMPAMFEASAVAHARAFDLPQLRAIREFSQSPIGRDYFSRLPSLMADPAVRQANEAYFAEVHTLSQEAMVELMQKVRTYLEQNPDVRERIEARVGQALPAAGK